MPRLLFFCFSGAVLGAAEILFASLPDAFFQWVRTRLAIRSRPRYQIPNMRVALARWGPRCPDAPRRTGEALATEFKLLQYYASMFHGAGSVLILES